MISVHKEYLLNLVIAALMTVGLIHGIQAQQNKEVNPNGFNKFYYDNGKISSEGSLKNGKPDGQWKNYYENGILKSAGNRKEFMLDGVWKFYNDLGVLLDEITYEADKRNGVTRHYSKEGFLETSATYKEDVKEGPAYTYYENGAVHLETPFVNGLEHGVAYEFSDQGEIIAVLTYKQGVLQKQEVINRKDVNGEKTGGWKEFYEDRRIKSEGRYRNNEKDGYWKEYTATGELIGTTKYKDGVLITDAEELSKLQIQEEYYDSGEAEGHLKFRGTFREGKRHGTHIWFAPDGSIDSAKVYKNDVLIAQGVLDRSGMRIGYWKEFYYPGGELKSEGEYKSGYRFGEWSFYYANGALDQKGKYIEEGKLDGKWIWYYENGAKLREESFAKGREQGMLTEYSDSGNVVKQGEFVTGKEEGEWFYQIGDHKEIGNYEGGLKQGVWKHFFLSNDKLRFEGEYYDDLPNGKHTWYYDSGEKRLEGKFVNGIKEGLWRRYNPDGTVFLEIEFQSGREVKVDGEKMKEPALGDSIGEE